MATNALDAKGILEEYRGIVWPSLKRYLVDPIYPKSFQISSVYKKDVADYWKIIREYPERQGKYLRPTLLILTAEAMGQQKEEAINTAIAMQLSEEWLLVHDDFQDHSLMRRGKPALHRLYGPELAINAGDSLHVIMWKVIINNLDILGKAKTFRVAEEFYKTLLRTAHGQAIEIVWSQVNNLNFRDDDWFFIADGKTSYYTIATPMRLGAIIADANAEEIDCITTFGMNLGRCFQLVDDILDVTVDYKKQGLGNDIYENKKTIMLMHLVRKAKNKDKKKLLSIIHKSTEEKSKDDVSWVIQQMHNQGSIEYARNLANNLKNKSLDMFRSDLTFLSYQPARAKLEALSHFILERDH